MRTDQIRETLLCRVKSHARLVNALRKPGQVPILRTIDADETLDVVVPRRDILVAHGPGYSMAILGIGLEVHRRHAVGVPAPHEGAAPQVVAPNPAKAALRWCLIDVDVVIDEIVKIPLVEFP